MSVTAFRSEVKKFSDLFSFFGKEISAQKKSGADGGFRFIDQRLRVRVAALFQISVIDRLAARVAAPKRPAGASIDLITMNVSDVLLRSAVAAELAYECCDE